MISGNIAVQPYLTNYNQYYQAGTGINQQQGIDSNSIFSSLIAPSAGLNGTSSIFQSQPVNNNGVSALAPQQNNNSMMQELMSVLLLLLQQKNTSSTDDSNDQVAVADNKDTTQIKNAADANKKKDDDNAVNDNIKTLDKGLKPWKW